MKVRIIHRNDAEYIHTKDGQLQKYFRNPDKRLFPFEREREYIRALNATKMEKMFAKPFLFSLDGHTDSVKCITKAHTKVAELYSSACDGEIRIWNLEQKCCEKAFRAHDGFIRGLCLNPCDTLLLSCGDDKKIKSWNIEKNRRMENMDLSDMLEDHCPDEKFLDNISIQHTPRQVFSCPSIITSIDHHWTKTLFASAGETVDIWDHGRTSPIQSFSWDCENYYKIRFNPAEHYLLASAGGDNSIMLYDIRGNTPIRKVILKMKTNALSWNPMEPLNLTSANEDQNLYTFDIRKFDSALCVHKDFTNAVLDVDYSPTGKEFVAASFDRTLRLFKTGDGRSRDVYHTKRMQSVFSCLFSSDSRFVMSGSADMCIRVWKARADDMIGPRSYRERQAICYRKSLKKKYENLKEIKRIMRHQHVPKIIKTTQERKRLIEEAKTTREQNKRLHSKPGIVPRVAARKKMIFKEIE